MENKQTAINWLYDNLKSHFEHDGDLLEGVQYSFEQAKEIYEKQMIEYGRFCVQCHEQGFIIPKNK
jgi:hypothetical protein